MTKSFYTTEPYREARKRAQHDLDNWPDDEFDELPGDRDRSRLGLAIICAALAFGIVLIWMGLAYHVRTTPSPTLVHQSSSL